MIEPMAVDVVIAYAQSGHSRHTNVYTDRSFVVWGDPLRDAAEVPCALGGGTPIKAAVEFADALHRLAAKAPSDAANPALPPPDR